MSIQELLDKRESVNGKHSAGCRAVQAAFEAECLAAWKKRFPKRKFAMAKSSKDNQPEHVEIYKRYKIQADDLHTKYRAEVDEINSAIKEAAKDAEIPAFDGMTLYDVVDSNAYRSQGFGEHKYARADAEDRADKARAYGLRAEVREVVVYEGKDSFGYSTKTSNYEIWVSTNELGVQILKNKPEKETMADWVKKCDRAGVCARVFYPFMTYEQEEQFRRAK